MPMALSVAAAIKLVVPVPCHELPEATQSLNTPEAFSAVVTQSPGSLASLSRPSPSLAEAASVTKS